MAKKVLTNLDLVLNQLLNTRLHQIAGNPSTLVESLFWYDSTTKKPMYYDGTNAKNFGIEYTPSTGIDITDNVISVDFDDVATAAQGALADTAIQPNDNISELTNDVGYITGITSGDVTTALGYTPYNSSNPSGYQANVIETIKVNNTALTPTSKTVNITIPTQANDIGALPNSTKYGATIVVSLNTTDYKLTITLKDQDGNTLGTSQVVDFPIESVVVGASYDNTNKKIILTLQNGNTVDVPVGDLVSGLQTEITSTNKLNADLVDDSTSTNKFVKSFEKSYWNSKQDAISDLSTIRSGASDGATAVQKYSTTNPSLTQSGGLCTWTITHNLGTKKVQVTVYETSSGDEVIVDSTRTSISVVTVKINSTSNITAGTYTVVVQGK